MVTFDNMLLATDELVTRIFSDWDIYSTGLLGGLIIFITVLTVWGRDPDTHPMLLSRQAQPSPVRNPGESSVYRSHSSPHGMELNTGLNVKDPGQNKWSRGRNGDLRDVWRKAVRGRTDPEGKPTGEKGRIITIVGTEQTIDHDLDEVSRQINIIGQYLKHHGGSRVAIYLPNSIELLAALFACTFYDLTPILLPYDQPAHVVVDMLKLSEADTLVTAVGNLPFDAVTKDYAGLKNLIWVVDEGSKHLDWDEIPTGSGGAINVSTWQEVVEEQSSVSSELPPLDKTSSKNVLSFWFPENNEPGELVEYTHGNLVSAISAQISAIPTSQKIGPSDLFFPSDSLSSNYTLVLTLAALYYNASLALNSVAGRETDLRNATRGVAPTIIVASAHTLAQVHANTASKLSNVVYNLIHWFQTRTLTENGVMPVASVFSRLNDGLKPAIGTTPGKLRLVFVSERAGGNSPPLSALALNDLRIFTGARVVYALTAPKVAGAVTQTSFYDYRVDPKEPGQYSHFGAPVSSVEVFLKDTKHRKVTDEEIQGEVVARGPAVVGGEASLGIVGRINEDNTLAYL
ncbi:hypothetical protein VE03_03062 [Pseudogymnoascus sp. 23342-1-I1]|nr:hypothetical protein VE03_03062 [Pseudogymnoascus sp. 23342-1-I1]